VEPKLLAISGPLRNSDFVVADSLSIGRDPQNSICVDDPALSAFHCRISHQDGCYVLTDLDSAAGTFVNGIPIQQRTLSLNDEISVGTSVLSFQAQHPKVFKLLHAAPLGDQPPSIPPQQVRQDELLYHHPESLAALPQSSRLSRNLSALLRINAAIATLRDADALQWQLLGMIFDVVPAQRGAILFIDPASGEVSSQIVWDRILGPEHPVHINPAVLKRVIEGRVSLLDNSAHTRETLSDSPATDSQPVQSILCVPLSAADQPFGVIYLDTSNPATPFSGDDLQLVSAVAGLASIAIENARQFERLDTENRQLRAEVNLDHDMLGQTPRMREVYRFIERVAPSDATVLIHGESGTGKELTARAIHKNSTRRALPFVALNCAALTETLLESELFGHEKGSFTGAFAQKKGLVEVAEGGTLFLDEVGELSPILQAKLLRVLQEREFVRVGGTRSIKINVRFLAATNRNLQKAVRDEQFRADLFHRLNVISITLPPLREHPQDIPLLAGYFANRYGKKCNRLIRGISDDARTRLLQYDWPGNVRELENAIERAVVIGSSELLLPEDLPESLLDSPATLSAEPAKYHDAVRDLKKQIILSSLEQTSGNFTEAARLLGVHPNYLHRLIRNLDLRLSLKKPNRA
jgi:transcriptional regulator with GAF, ATPase, and Fis domain